MAGLVETFQAFSGVLVVCPCCGQLLRLSDLKLRFTGKFERTVLDALLEKEWRLGKREEALDRRRERFEAKEKQLRDEARTRGRQKYKRVIRKLDPSLGKLPYDPQDIKTISHPVDLIVFDGLAAGEQVKNVVLVARSQLRGVASVRRSIEKALERGNYLWETVRVGIDGAVTVEAK